MSRQIVPADIAEFCRDVVASGLVDADSIALVVREFQADGIAARKFGSSLTAFGNYLVSRDILTTWQCAKLRNGQYRGFYLDDYTLLDHIGADESCSRYLAEDRRTSKYVVLCICPPAVSPLEDGKPKYRVEEFRT